MIGVHQYGTGLELGLPRVPGYPQSVYDNQPFSDALNGKNWQLRWA
ncbi:hypothetical protein BH23CHL2_BH23CHL2_07400 [soil metagenome]